MKDDEFTQRIEIYTRDVLVQAAALGFDAVSVDKSILLDFVAALTAERDALKAKVATLREALEWYEKKENYQHKKGMLDEYRQFSDIDLDFGKRARSALEKAGGK